MPIDMNLTPLQFLQSRTHEELLTILEMARLAFDYAEIIDATDLTDRALDGLQEDLNAYMNQGKL